MNTCAHRLRLFMFICDFYFIIKLHSEPKMPWIIHSSVCMQVDSEQHVHVHLFIYLFIYLNLFIYLFNKVLYLFIYLFI